MIGTSAMQGVSCGAFRQSPASVQAPTLRRCSALAPAMAIRSRPAQHHKEWHLQTRRSADTRIRCPVTMAAQTQEASSSAAAGKAIGWKGVHHVGLLVQDLDKSRHFYEEILGLKLNPERPDDRLPYGGAWFWLGPEMIHLMVLPNPDPLEGRPEHGGRDRHAAVGVESVDALQARLEEFSIPFTRSKSGRNAIFFRDPDQNVLECVELEDWR